METSALVSVGRYLSMNVCSELMVTVKHPIEQFQESWGWKLLKVSDKNF